MIQIDDGPLESIDQIVETPRGEIGELMVRGPVVTQAYVTRTESNALHKVQDGETVWHRMGDVGYLDDQDRFWFCGRKGHRIETEQGTLFTIRCEAIFNRLKFVYRSALVGVGPEGRKRPILIAEPWPEDFPQSPEEHHKQLEQLREAAAGHPLTSSVETFFLHQSLPVDIRHNSKIFREKLAVWAEQQLASSDG